MKPVLDLFFRKFDFQRQRPSDAVGQIRRRPLEQWRAEIDAAPARQQKAAERAARMAEPEAKPAYVERGATVRTVEEVDVWLGRQRERLLEAIKRGPAVIS